METSSHLRCKYSGSESLEMARRMMLGLLLWLIAGPALASRLVQEERVPKVDDELGVLLKENPATMQLGHEGRVKLEGRGVNGRRSGGYGHGHGGALRSFLKENPASRSRHLEHEERRLNGRGDGAIPSLPEKGPASRASSHSEHEGRVQLERRRLNGRGGGHGGGGRGRGRGDHRPGQGRGDDDKGDDKGGGGGGDGGTGICIGYCPGGGSGGGGGGGGGSTPSASTQSTTMTPASVTSPNTTTP